MSEIDSDSRQQPGQTPAQTRLSPEAFLEKRRTEPVAYVFDLRDAEAYAAGHLPGAFSLPLEQLEPNLSRLPFSGAMLFHDGGEGLAAQAVRLLEDNGFTDFFYAEEGLAALQAALAASPDDVRYADLGPEERRAAVEKVLDEQVREFLARDGGGMEVLEIEDDRIKVAYQGACGGCSSATAGTLFFIQTALTRALNHEIQVVPVDL